MDGYSNQVIEERLVMEKITLSRDQETSEKGLTTL